MSITIVSRNKATGQKTLYTSQSTTGAGLPQPSADDVVQDLLAYLVTLAPDLPPEVLARADRYARDTWGGSRPYISKKLGEGISHRNAAIRRHHQNGLRVGAIARLMECSESQVERALGWK